MLHKHPKMQCGLARRIFGRNGRGSRLGNFCWVLAFVVLSGRIAPQVFAAEMQLQILHEFFPGGTNLTLPDGRLVQANDGEFYGAASVGYGAPGGYGAVFKITSRGNTTVLCNFNAFDYPPPPYDLFPLPVAGLDQLPTGEFYGVFRAPGLGSGVFRFRTNGTPLLEFLIDGIEGNLVGPLTHDGIGNLYCETAQGGSNGMGSLVKFATNEVLTTLHSFNGTNGATPFGSLLLASDGNLYGTTSYGGTGYLTGNAATGYGTVFRATTNGTLTTLFYFAGTNGAQPHAGLTLGTDGNLYSTTVSGGDYGHGTVFKLTPTGTLTVLTSFDGTNGAGPYSGVTEGWDGKFYGVTAYGGMTTTNSYLGSFGTIYCVTTNGQFNVIARFDGTNALNPSTEFLLANDGNLYGLAFDEYKKLSLDGNAGTFFRLAQVPSVTSLSRSNGNVNLEWTAFTNGVYRVERRTSLDTGGWTGFETNIISTGAIARFTDPSPMLAANYYRVVLLP
jgi:uncharacterized repeat protein (TIGR03803 family)